MDDSTCRIARFAKRPPPPFGVFMEGFRKEFKEKHPESKGVAARAKAGGDKWRAMSDAEKAPFVSIAEQRKKDYDEKFRIYANKLVEEKNDDEPDKSDSKVSDEESDKTESEVSDEEEEESSEKDEDDD